MNWKCKCGKHDYEFIESAVSDEQNRLEKLLITLGWEYDGEQYIKLICWKHLFDYITLQRGLQLYSNISLYNICCNLELYICLRCHKIRRNISQSAMDKKLFEYIDYYENKCLRKLKAKYYYETGERNDQIL